MNLSEITPYVTEKLKTRGGQVDLARALGFLESHNSQLTTAKTLGMSDKECLGLYISDDFVIVKDNYNSFKPLVLGKHSHLYFETLDQAIIYGILLKSYNKDMYPAIAKLTGVDKQ